MQPTSTCLQISDSVGLRQRIQQQFELASLPGTSMDDMQQVLHFVVVGGGPTGAKGRTGLHWAALGRTARLPSYGSYSRCPAGRPPRLLCLKFLPLLTSVRLPSAAIQVWSFRAPCPISCGTT